MERKRHKDSKRETKKKKEKRRERVLCHIWCFPVARPRQRRRQTPSSRIALLNLRIRSSFASSC